MEFLIKYVGFGLLIVTFSWLLPKRFQLKAVSVLTAVGFAYLDWQSAVLLIMLSVISYWLLLKNYRHKTLTLGVLLSLIILFIVIKANKSFEYNYQHNIPVLLGFSFYMFRLIHLNIECYKNNIQHASLWNWLHYLLFFPVLLVGPINRYASFEREIRRRRWDAGLFSQGLERLLYGFVKIVFFGNYLAGIVFELYLRKSTLTVNSWLYQYLDAFQYTFNAYFQFAGYIDLAIGLSYLIGVRVLENFNFPFLATSIDDFWKRWHISLSQWCRDYVYLPIASYTRWPVLGILVSMLILGLWHELSWRYVLWAVTHGVAIIVWQYFGRNVGVLISNSRVNNGISWFFTINFVILSFGIIKDDRLEDTINAIKVILLIN